MGQGGVGGMRVTAGGGGGEAVSVDDVHQEKLFLTWECLWSPGKLCEGLDIDRNLRK